MGIDRGRMRRARMATVVVAVVGGGLAAGAQAASADGPCGTSGTFSASGSQASCLYANAQNTGLSDTFTVPAYATSIDVTAVGGRGGDGYEFHYFHGGGGIGGYGSVMTDQGLAVTGGSTLTVTVAGNGQFGQHDGGGAGGFGGGGAGGSPNTGTYGGGGGGGASSVFDGPTALVVASGGGGGGGAGVGGAGGSGDQSGADGPILGCLGGGAGTTTAGGAGGNAPATVCTPGIAAGDGSLGQGGTGGNSNDYTSGGGGGGGLYGGGGGQGSDAGDAAGGGGGASYASSGTSAVTTDTTGTPSVQISWELPTVGLATEVLDAGSGTAWGGETTGAVAYDSATVTASGPAPTAGVTFNLYTNNSCTGNPASSSTSAISGGTASSSSTGALTAGDYSFQAVYPGDAYYAPATGSCEPFSVAQGSAGVGQNLIDADGGNPWNNWETANDTAIDQASVTGGAITPTGSLTYAFYANGSCTGTPAATWAYSLSPTGSVPTSGNTPALAAGTYGFQATYSGDGNYTQASSTCLTFSVTTVAKLVISQPASTTVNKAQTVTVKAENSSGHVVTSYDGPVSIYDGSGQLSQTLTFQGGVSATSVAFANPAKTDRITAAASTLSASTRPFNVVGPLATFAISVPRFDTAGKPFTVRVYAEDAAGNVITTYAGAPSWSDASGQLTGSPAAFKRGLSSTAVTLAKAVKADTITVTAGGVSSTSGTFRVF